MKPRRLVDKHSDKPTFNIFSLFHTFSYPLSNAYTKQPITVDWPSYRRDLHLAQNV
jgi:hypothetical protein